MTPHRKLPYGVDFAALRTLLLVHDFRSFTAAASELEVNQSAISYTIEKLRNAFSDPLFFRQGGKVVPTERCDSIARLAADMLGSFEKMALAPDFNPGTADDTITIACNYYERLIILPVLVRKLNTAAPRIRLQFINATHQGAELLKRGQADILMGPLKPDEADFFCRTLVEDRYICVMDRSNPLCSGALEKTDYLKAKHAIVTYGGEWRSQYLKDMDAEGVSPNIALQIPSPAGLEQFLPGTDLISTVPSRLGKAISGNLALVECPYPAPFHLYMVWTTRTHHSAMFSWFRALVMDAVKRSLEREI